MKTDKTEFRVCFIDIDGVLTTLETKWKTFHPDCVKALKRVIDQTNAVLVLSSCWRHGFIDWRNNEMNLVSHKDALTKMGELFTECGLPAEALIGKTPTDFKGHRGTEIDQWLKNHPSVDKFIILDDDNDMEPHMDRLILTHPDLGMNEQDADKAILLLTS